MTYLFCSYLYYIFDFKQSKEFKSNISSYKFKEITVVEDFEIENGLLGLDRDLYLSIVKFLHPSRVRKV
jgi:hypothetical protein